MTAKPQDPQLNDNVDVTGFGWLHCGDEFREWPSFNSNEAPIDEPTRTSIIGVGHISKYSQYYIAFTSFLATRKTLCSY